MRRKKQNNDNKGIFKEGSGRYVCKTRETYKGQSWTCKGTSKDGPAAAREAWARNRERKQREIDAAEDREAGRIKLEEGIRDWYKLYKLGETNRGRQRSGQTIRTDRGTISGICKDLGNIYLCDLTSDILQRDLVQLRDRGVSQSIIDKRWRMLSMYLRHVYGERSPLRRCVRPCAMESAGEETKQAYNAEQIDLLVEELRRGWCDGMDRACEYQGYRCGGLLCVILYEFLRLGEALELRAEDIDLDRGIIHVRRQYQETTDRVTPPKYKSARDVPVMDEVRDILEEVIRDKPAGALLWERWQQDNRYTGHITQGRVREDLRRACERSGVPVHTVHDLRHDGISRVVDLGVKPQSVSRWAGHKSLSITLDIYYRHGEDMDREDLDKVQRR